MTTLATTCAAPSPSPHLAATSPPARLSGVAPLVYTAGDTPTPHVRAGSAVRRWGGQLVVAQDDVNGLGLVSEGSEAGRQAVTALLLPADASGQRVHPPTKQGKAVKLDLEASALLPDGRLLFFGSGSRPTREVIAVVEAGPDGAAVARTVDARALYGGLAALGGAGGLNLEGAAVSGGSLRLFHRGNGAPVDGVPRVSSIGELDLAAFVAWLDGASAAPALRRVTPVDLGTTSGVAWGFTDAAALPDGRVAFLAGAEASADTVADGAILGTRVGLLDGDRVVALAEILDEAGAPTRLKLEGLELLGRGEDGTLTFAVVADMDDPDVPAALGTLTWRPD